VKQAGDARGEIDEDAEIGVAVDRSLIESVVDKLRCMVSTELEDDIFLMTVTNVTAINRDVTDDTRTHLLRKYGPTL
jgi:hypothetical protein